MANFKMNPGSREISSPGNFRQSSTNTLNKLSFGRKLFNTIVQGAKDIGHQAKDLVNPDPIRRNLINYDTSSLYAKQKIKKEEQANYDKSRKMASEGKTFGSLANFFDDSGEGNILGTNRRSQRRTSGR